jgi:hypothetical protein
MNENRLISLVEYAKLENITPRAARLRIRSGKLQAVKIGWAWVVNRPVKAADPA